MSIIPSVLIPSPGTKTLPFWPDGRTQLVITFEILDDGRAIARIFDPDVGAVVLKATLRVELQAAFIAAVRTGEAGTPVDPAANPNIDTDTVVITPPGNGSDPGPKYTVTLQATDATAA
ncbi:MAG: hypothetical protein E6J90_32910 [Deltaproteobacteria bacterium]|nr:MAG: hypothetical protein E6J90_32910 [Deltaproteobacteria bacterium]